MPGVWHKRACEFYCALLVWSFFLAFIPGAFRGIRQASTWTSQRLLTTHIGSPELERANPVRGFLSFSKSMQSVTPPILIRSRSICWQSCSDSFTRAFSLHGCLLLSGCLRRVCCLACWQSAFLASVRSA